MGSVPLISLASSSTTAATIQALGFGTATWPLAGSETMKRSVLHAIKLGYRHFDTAAVYQSEHTLGEAIAQALQLGLIGSRAELFVTSKLWCTDAHPPLVVPTLQKTLKRLGLEYVDLYLIHNPVSLKSEGYDLPFDKKDLVPMDFKGVWEGMEECHKIGLAKNIGVSNFSIKKLQRLLLTSKIPPAVNQVEMSPLWQQSKLREFCESKGIHVSAFSPLGARDTPWGNNSVMDCPVLKEIADAKGKTIAQVCLRWVHEQGASVIVKSFNEERMKENLDIFDWKLCHEETKKIEQIPQQRVMLAYEYVSENGPFTTLEELWDEKI